VVESVLNFRTFSVVENLTNSKEKKTMSMINLSSILAFVAKLVKINEESSRNGVVGVGISPAEAQVIRNLVSILQSRGKIEISVEDLRVIFGDNRLVEKFFQDQREAAVKADMELFLRRGSSGNTWNSIPTGAWPAKVRSGLLRRRTARG